MLAALTVSVNYRYLPLTSHGRTGGVTLASASRGSHYNSIAYAGTSILSHAALHKKKTIAEAMVFVVRQ